MVVVMKMPFMHHLPEYCTTCKWREEVIDRDTDPNHDIQFCSRMHEKFNLIDMVSYLGYSKEGREKDTYPMYEEQEGEE